MATSSTGKTVSIQGTDAEQEVLFWFRQNKVNLENMMGKKIKSMTLSWTLDGTTQLIYEEVDPAPVAAPEAPTA